jgi:hypothetical protein
MSSALPCDLNGQRQKSNVALLQATPNTVVFAKKNKGCRIPIGI